MSQNLPPTTALNFRRRRIQHKWSQEERMILCCMKRFFDLSNRDITKIFNTLYETKIRNEGFPDGLPRSTVNTQWEDLRRKRHSDFNLVHQEVSFAQGPTHFSQLLDKIRVAARRLHIGLVARARDLEITAQERVMQSERRALPSSTILAPSQGRRMTIGAPHTSLSSNLLSHDRQVQTPSVSTASSAPIMPAISTVPAAPPGSTQTSEVSAPIARIRSYTLQSGTNPPTRPRNVPTLLWRFSNDDSMGLNHRSGYIASAFLNDIGNIPSPEQRDAEFPTWLEIHVRPRRIPSPFISTSTDPLVPIHRALTRGNNAFVCLVDATQINPQHIFYMRDLMRQYQIYTPGYRGAKEYIIWGSIGRGAIVVSFHADQLMAISNEYPDIENALQLNLISASANCKSQLYNRLSNRTFESDLVVGKVVGKFLGLLHLQEEYLDDVALAFNNSWSFSSSNDNADFLRGIHQGYQNVTLPLQNQDQTSAPQSQVTASQSQSELDHISLNDESTSNIDPENQDIHDYVIVDHQQDQVDRTIQEQQLRQSIDRLSIVDDSEAPPAQNHSRVLASPSPTVIARTMATRRISLFDQRSDSWVLVPDTRPSTPGREQIIPSIEHETPPRAQIDTERPQDTSPETPTTSPQVKRARSDSLESESTLGPSTPARPFSRERSHVDRVLGIDWPSFWDSMQNHAQ